MLGNLSFEFVTIIEEGERVIISLAYDFGLAALDHAFDLGDVFGAPFFGLVEPSAGNTKGDFDAWVFLHIAFEEVEHGPVTFLCNFPKNPFVTLSAVIIIMEVIGISTNIKNGILSVADRLMDV